MSEYNFKPDFLDWWERQSISQENCAWLIMGIDPDKAMQVNEALKRAEPQRSDEEKLLISSFDHFNLMNDRITLSLVKDRYIFTSLQHRAFRGELTASSLKEAAA